MRSGREALKSASVSGLVGQRETSPPRRRRRTKRWRNAGLIFIFWLVGALILGAVLYSMNNPAGGRKGPVQLPGQDTFSPRKK